ncbi:MAG TPA: MgtC/SapB family protein [Reyranellaceae bacterium]|nr:MgtC/SapB family protein [Reyranellaceae bacterium]
MPDFNPFDHPLILGFLVALGLGLLIGVDRERQQGSGGAREAAGIRTFTIASLSGAAAIAVGGEVLLAVVTIAVAGLIGLAYMRERNHDPGLTTEAALVLTTLLGGLAMRQPAFAAAIAVVVTVLLTARENIHRFVRSSLTEKELRDGLIFAAATLVVLPLLPDEPIGPYQALNLRTVWIVVILVMAIGAVGYIATRVLGSRFGLPITGLASGFVSSTATIAAMGSRAKKTPKVLKPAAAGAVLSTVATVVQLAIVLAATSLETLRAFWVPLIAAGLAAIAYGGLFTLWALRDSSDHAEKPGSAFSLGSALAFAGILAVVLVLSAALQKWLGETGVIVAAAVGGFADAHSASVSTASLVAGGKIKPPDAVWGILAALTTNTLSKAFFAVSNGGRTFALLVIPGLLLVIAAAWAAALLVKVAA